VDIADPYWVYLLRVGADLGIYGGGFHGPIFSGGSFEFVPIPDCEVDRKYRKTVYGRLIYGNTTDRQREHVFLDYIQNKSIKKKLRSECMHPDPDFAKATYGDLMKVRKDHSLKSVSKAASLKFLKPGNLLVFCASLDPFNNVESKRALYMIGYFEVKEIHDFSARALSKEERWKICREFRERNSHCAIGKVDDMDSDQFKCLVLVEGIAKNSTLLDRAVQLTDEDYRILPRWAKELGLNHTTFLRGGRWLPQRDREDLRKRKNYVLKLKELLKEYGRYSQHLRIASHH